jgi:hypothetical protein
MRPIFMSNTLKKRLRTGILNALIFTSAHASAASVGVVKVLWSEPIAEGRTQNGIQDPAVMNGVGPVLQEASKLADGTIVFRTSRCVSGSGCHDSLLFATGENVKETELSLNGAQQTENGSMWRSFWERLYGAKKENAHPMISSSTIAETGDIWLIGSTNNSLDFASAPHNDQYVARLDPSGHPQWEKAYQNRWRHIVFAEPSSNSVIAGGREYFDVAWMAKWDQHGQKIWDKYLENSSIITAKQLADDKLIVFGARKGKDAAGSAEKAGLIWFVNKDGQISSPKEVRKFQSPNGGTIDGEIAVNQRSHDFYVASVVEDLMESQPVEVSKMDQNGNISWTKTFPSTVWPDSNHHQVVCIPTITTLSNGDALLGCAKEQKIMLFRLASKDGNIAETRAKLPDCQKYLSTQLFLFPNDDETMLAAGSRRNGNVAASCSWIGKLAVPKS